ncbi:acid protease [Trametes coccinea BRFM310]|uniref:Acid protease n=1 Tax=Trametes coccinea (strain BRFM310) TaxID=1353009 RepID=A0A1Y2IF75_TRAC3|nr:acid protease [Trametes coccinea BRFM310]
MSPHSLVTLLFTFVLSISASPLPTLPTDPTSLLSSSGLATDDLSTTSSPVPALSLARRFNHTGSANVLRFDQARARAMRGRTGSYPETYTSSFASGKVFEIDATSQAVSYVVTVNIGNPPTSYQLLVDTGSSNTFVGAGKTFVMSSTTLLTTNIMGVQYGSGFFDGSQVYDDIELAEGLIIKNQSIGVADVSEGFDGVDGILGIGPTDLTCAGTIVGEPDKCDPTVTDNAWNMGLLDAHQVGISFGPTQSLDDKNGELTFGGVDPTKFRGLLDYVPLTLVSPASSYVGYEQSINYGDMGTTNVLDHTAGILDTGTTLVLIATDAFEKYQQLTGAVADEDTGLLRITPEQYGALQNLNFRIGEKDYPLVPNAQIWPRALNEAIGGVADGIYLIVNDIGADSGQGLDFINGMSFLERYYSVYDIGGSRVGFAETQYTRAETN